MSVKGERGIKKMRIDFSLFEGGSSPMENGKEDEEFLFFGNRG
jgi:hypothetical protein